MEMDFFMAMPPWVATLISAEWMKDVSKFLFCFSIAVWVLNGKLNKLTGSATKLVEEGKEYFEKSRKDISVLLEEVRDYAEIARADVKKLIEGVQREVVELRSGVKDLADAMKANNEAHSHEIKLVDDRLNRQGATISALDTRLALRLTNLELKCVDTNTVNVNITGEII